MTSRPPSNEKTNQPQKRRSSNSPSLPTNQPANDEQRKGSLQPGTVDSLNLAGTTTATNASSNQPNEDVPSPPATNTATNATATTTTTSTNAITTTTTSTTIPTTSSKTNVDTAPIDLKMITVKTLLLILEHCSYYEIFRYRKVSKSWQKIIDNELKMKELTIFLKQFPFNDVWSFTNDQLKVQKSLKITKLSQFFKSNQVKLFKNIERLCIYNFPSDYEQLDLEHLNQFTNLTHLELKNLKLKDQSKLNLPALKLLTLFKQSSGKVKIDAPQLIKFKTSFNLNHFKIEHPESIQFLECTHFNSCIKNFVNLEFLYVEFISHLSSIFLQQMTKLKEIQFFDFGITNNVFNSLKKQKKKYDRKELNIFYLGINFDHFPETNFKFERFHLNEYNVHYYADNYKTRLATSVPFIRKLNYNALIKRFNEIPKDIHIKFPNIGFVIVDNRLNCADSFIKFLYKCKALRILTLRNSSIDQKHLDLLPEVAPALTYLTFEHESNKINFNFILKFRNIIKFQVDQFVAFGLVQQCFEKLNFLKSFHFRIQSGTILIKKSNYYLLIISDHYQDCFNNLENLIKVLKKNYALNSK